MQPTLSPTAIKRIDEQVDFAFDRLKARYLGPQSVSKRIRVSYIPELSLPGIFLAANAEEANHPDMAVLRQLLRVAEGYLDAERARAKGQVLKTVTAFLNSGVKTDAETVLGGQLAEIWGRVSWDVRRIVDTEATAVRNVGVLDGITKINALSGIDDPVCYFVIVRDEHTCDECKKIHLREDGKPRVWRLSEVEHGYHEKGVDRPSMSGLHPHCRCSLVTVMPGYGFDHAGRIVYIGPGHDEFARQRGL